MIDTAQLPEAPPDALISGKTWNLLRRGNHAEGLGTPPDIERPQPPRNEEWNGIVVETGPNGEGEPTNNTYWIKNTDITNGSSDGEYSRLELAERSSFDESLRWELATNLAEQTASSHIVPIGTPVRVTAIRDQFGIRRWTFNFSPPGGLSIEGCNPVDGAALGVIADDLVFGSGFTLTPLLPGYRLDLNLVGDSDYFTNELDQFIRIVDEPADPDFKCGVKVIVWDGIGVYSYCAGGGATLEKWRNITLGNEFKRTAIDVSKAHYKLELPLHADNDYMEVPLNASSGSGCNGYDVNWLGMHVKTCANAETGGIKKLRAGPGLDVSYPGGNQADFKILLREGTGILITETDSCLGPIISRDCDPTDIVLSTQSYLTNARYDPTGKTFYQRKGHTEFTFNFCDGTVEKLDVDDGESVVFTAQSCPTPSGLSMSELAAS